MREIPLTRGKVAQIDDGDWERVAPYSWVAGKRGRTWYAQANINGTLWYLHRWIMGLTGGVDHRDRNGLNNQRDNLRPASWSQNQANRIKSEGDFSSSYKGVSWDPQTEKWRASANIAGRAKNLGRYIFAHEAALAYDRAAIEEWGEFACLNFPRSSRDERTTILMVGWGRSGKDSGAEILAHLTGLRYGFSFSRAALPFMCEFLGQDEKTAWEERHHHRMAWKSHLDHLRMGDETLLAEMALGCGEILAGLRDKKELLAVRAKGLFNYILWVNRPGIPPDPTTTFGPSYADEIIENVGTLDEYGEILKRWALSKGLIKP